jgi:hypothetical protein
MATLYFDENFVSHVSDFCREKHEITKKVTFVKNYDFMIFAALVGRHYHDSCADVEVKHSQNEIPDRIFYDNSKEGIAYLLALDAEKSGDILKEETDNECWKYLEKYAYLGCEKISTWIADRQDVNMDINDVILNKIMEIAAENIGQEPSNGDSTDKDEIDF